MLSSGIVQTFQYKGILKLRSHLFENIILWVVLKLCLHVPFLCLIG